MVGIRKAVIVAFIALALVPGNSNAQDMSLYNSGVLYDAVHNPERHYFRDTCKGFAWNLLIPTIDVNLAVQGKLNHYIYEILADQELNFRNIGPNRKGFNSLNVYTRVEPVLMKLRMDKEHEEELSINVSAIADSRVTLDNNFLLFLSGNKSSAGTRLDHILSTRSYASIYAEAGLGYRRRLSDALSAGIKLGLLNGLADARALIPNSYMETDSLGRYIELMAEGNIYLSFDPDKETDPVQDFLRLRNPGYSLSGGLSWDMNDRVQVGVGAKNFGAISWNESAVRYGYSFNTRYEGDDFMSNDQSQDSVRNNLLNLISDTGSGSYRSYLPGRLETYFAWKPGSRLTTTLMISKEWYYPQWDFLLNNDFRYRKKGHMVVNTMVNTNGFYSLGLMKVKKGKWLEYYAGNEFFGNTTALSHYLSNPGQGMRLPISFGFTYGVVFKFGYCKKKKATEVANVPVYDPDSDGDGIPDSKDLCPGEPGTIGNNGCPVILDSDGDGIRDEEDQCPLLAGPVSNKGCPLEDTDGDGLLDRDDACPTVAGPIDNKGCPYQDSDGDGVIDRDDKCPLKFGLPEFGGCPEPQKAKLDTQEIEVINKVFKSLRFETGRAVIDPSSYNSLDQLAELLNRRPHFKVLIEGHTDDMGKRESNLELSKERAEAVMTYLSRAGIHPNRIITVGYGSSRPLAANDSPEGRAMNRRVEFTVVE